MPVVFSQLESELKRIIDQPEGLHFAWCLPSAPDGSLQLSGARLRAVNKEALKTTIRIYGLERCLTLQTNDTILTAKLSYWTAQPMSQVRLWETGIPEIDQHAHRQMEVTQPGRRATPMRLKRLVLDVEVGGVLYAAVEGYGWVFAATLNQQAMNKGKAEEQLASIVGLVQKSAIAKPASTGATPMRHHSGHSGGHREE